MIAAGEAGGILDTILKRLATYIEKAVKLKGQVKSAMIYPIAVIVHRRRSSSASFCGRSSRPSPRCSPASAPSCRCRRASSSRSATTWSRFVPFIVVGIGAIGYALQALLRDRRTGRRVDRRASLLKLPILGMILRKIAVARFCRTLSTLHRLGRADPRRPRHHRADRRQRDHRGRDHDDAQEHRARRDDRGAAARRPTSSRRWSCR